MLNSSVQSEVSDELLNLNDANIMGEMIDLIWLLNAGGNSAYELKGLLIQFLAQRQRFEAVAQKITDTCGDEAKRGFFVAEINRYLAEFSDLETNLSAVRRLLQEAAATLDSATIAPNSSAAASINDANAASQKSQFDPSQNNSSRVTKSKNSGGETDAE